MYITEKKESSKHLINPLNNIKYSPAKRSQASPCTRFHSLALIQKDKTTFQKRKWRDICSQCCSALIRSCLFIISSLTQMGWATQPLGRGGSSGGQRAVENWASRLVSLSQLKSITVLDEWRVKWLVTVLYMMVYPNISSEFPLSTACLRYALISHLFGHRWLEVQRGIMESQTVEASPGAWWGRLFSLTKDVRSLGWGKSCWSEFNSASMSCRAAHLWLVEEASFSSSVAWSSCGWREGVSSAGVGSCKGGGSDRVRNTGRQQWGSKWKKVI